MHVLNAELTRPKMTATSTKRVTAGATTRSRPGEWAVVKDDALSMYVCIPETTLAGKRQDRARRPGAQAVWPGFQAARQPGASAPPISVLTQLVSGPSFLSPQVCVDFDRVNRTLSYLLNGEPQGVAFRGLKINSNVHRPHPDADTYTNQSRQHPALMRIELESDIRTPTLTCPHLPPPLPGAYAAVSLYDVGDQVTYLGCETQMDTAALSR